MMTVLTGSTVHSQLYNILVCENEMVNIRANYTYTGDCAFVNTDWEDIDNIYLYISGKQIENGTLTPWYTSVQLNGITEEIDIAYYINYALTLYPENRGLITIVPRFYKNQTFGNDCLLDDNTAYRVINKSLIRSTLNEEGDLCPNQIIDLNQYLFNATPSVDYDGLEDVYGGQWTVDGISNNNNLVNLSGVSQGIYAVTYTKTINGCEVTKSMGNLNILSSETAGWTAEPPTSMLDTDPPIDLSIYIQSTGGTVFFEGSGVYQSGSTWYFDPGASGGAGNKFLKIGTVTPEGCIFYQSVEMQINVIEDPGVVSIYYIDLLYAGFDNILNIEPSFNFEYNWNNYPSGSTQNAPALMKSAQKGHSVCAGDTIKFKIGYVPNGYTFKWYSDITGDIQQVGTGLYYTEFVPETSTNMKYNIYAAGTNIVGTEGPKDPFILQVNPLPVSNEDTVINCHNGDSLLYSNLYYNHPLNQYFYPGNVLDTSYLNQMSSYNWYNQNDVFLTRGLAYNFIWDNISKSNEYITSRTISSDVIIDDVYNSWHPIFVPFYVTPPATIFPNGSVPSTTGIASFNTLLMDAYGRDVYYRITKCDCEEVNNSLMIASKRPESGFESNVLGDVEIGTAVQFLDSSLWKGTGTSTWSFGDGSYDYNADTIWHYFNEYGAFSVAQSVVDQYGCSSNNYNLNYITVTDYTSINENGNTIEFYPNPTTGIVNINGVDIKSIEIQSVSGQIIKFDSTTQIDLSDLSDGMYLIKIEFLSGQIITEKLLKQ